MGVDYRFDLLVGYSVPLKVVEAPYIIEVETKFHYEDRFDPKTGQKLKPAKIIDQRGGRFFQLQMGKRTFDSLYEVLEESDYFDAKFDCIVSMPFSCTEKVDIVNFSLPIPESPNFELGKFNLYGSKISLSWLDDNRMKLMKLKRQLELEFKIDIEEPSVFIESHIG